MGIKYCKNKNGKLELLGSIVSFVSCRCTMRRMLTDAIKWRRGSGDMRDTRINFNRCLCQETVCNFNLVVDVIRGDIQKKFLSDANRLKFLEINRVGLDESEYWHVTV